MATGTPSFRMFCLQHPKQKLAAEEYHWKGYNTLRASLTTEHVPVSLGQRENWSRRGKSRNGGELDLVAWGHCGGGRMDESSQAGKVQ